MAGADAIVPFSLDPFDRGGAERYEEQLKEEFAGGVDVVLDYLWGDSAKTVIVAIAKAVEDATPVRFVHVGGASGDENISLPGAALRSSPIQLMGSGLKSVPLPRLLQSIGRVFDAIVPAKLQIATRQTTLAEIGEAWAAPSRPRVVITLP